MKSERGVVVKDLFGDRLMSPEGVQRSMHMMGERLTTEFNERTKRRSEITEQVRKYRAPLIDVISKDERAAEGVTGLRHLTEGAQKRKPRAPHRAKAKERVYLGSFGATVVPPFDYEWTWSAVNGNPTQNSETADHNSGDMSVHIWTDLSDNGSSISGRAAVGTYFYPPAPNGSLQVWSSPAFTDDWGDWCAFDSAHADAWIGLYIGSYDLAGAPTGAVVDQQITLWSDDSWWSGVGSQGGSNSGYGLYAPPIQVDQDHQYAIWVWVGGDVSAAGWGTFSGSGAGDDLTVIVPSITWELG